MRWVDGVAVVEEVLEGHRVFRNEDFALSSSTAIREAVASVRCSQTVLNVSMYRMCRCHLCVMQSLQVLWIFQQRRKLSPVAVR